MHSSGSSARQFACGIISGLGAFFLFVTISGLGAALVPVTVSGLAAAIQNIKPIGATGPPPSIRHVTRFEHHDCTHLVLNVVCLDQQA